MLEYQPQPWDEWVEVGHLKKGRAEHATVSVGPQQLPCLAGADKIYLDSRIKIYFFFTVLALQAIALVVSIVFLQFP